MLANSHQTSTMEVPRRARSLLFGGMAGSLVVGLVIASMLLGLIWNHYEVRYPGADHQSANQFQVMFQYQTPDDLPKVLRWYVQHFGLSHEMPQGENCVMLTGEDAYLFLRGSLAVTLCTQQRGTLIIVNRSLKVR